MCAEQSPGGEKHAAAEPPAGLRSAAGPSGHENCGSRDRFGERKILPYSYKSRLKPLGTLTVAQ